MLNFNSVMLASDKPKALADFYEKIFEKKPDMADEGGWYGWKAGSCFLSVGPHSEVKGRAKEPQRIILNFETNDVKGEFARIKALGTKVVAEPYELQGAWIATFADPDGNFFQLMPPWEG